MGILRAIFSVLIPGGGALLRRKYLTAAAMMVAFMAFLQGYVVIRIVNPAGIPDYSQGALIGGFIGVLLINAAAEGFHLVRDRGLGAPGRLDELYFESLCAYMRRDDRKAEELLRDAMSRDGLEADFLFLRAQAARLSGKPSRAGRFFSKCRDFDEKGKWEWETRTALESLQGRRR